MPHISLVDSPDSSQCSSLAIWDSPISSLLLMLQGRDSPNSWSHSLSVLDIHRICHRGIVPQDIDSGAIVAPGDSLIQVPESAIVAPWDSPTCCPYSSDISQDEVTLSVYTPSHIVVSMKSKVFERHREMTFVSMTF